MLDKIDIYVKSTAIGITGIHWRHASESDQPIGTPKIVQEEVCKHKDGFPLMVNDLLDQTSPSLLVYRSSGKLLVEIAGIESVKTYGSHNDSQLRSYDLLALIFDDIPEYEIIVRKIAYDAIENILGKESKLFDMIKSFVSFYQKEEFRVDVELIKTYLEELDRRVTITEDNQNSKQKIEIRSNEKLAELSELILKNPLPKEWEFRDYNNDEHESPKSNGVLLVVTDRLEQEDIFYQAGVWFGLASNIKDIKDIKEPEILPIKPVIESEIKSQETIHQRLHGEEVNNNLKKFLIIIVIILSCIIAILLLKPINLNFQPDQIPHQKNNQL